MSKSIRIRTTPNGGDKYLKVNLEQDWDFIEILSLSISQQNAYRKFCSDYGVIVGRVTVNSGFGIPNAKVSVFIPLDSIDQQDPEISSIYPFEVVIDKDSDGIRYNLLPKDSDSQDDCYTPVGTFKSKREVLDNDTVLEVYQKYFKFTTTTNKAGDFMIFGVPLGTYTVHLDADISDIGIATQKPYDLISQGIPEKMFYSPTKFKSDTNLDKLIQIKSMNAGVNVQPFWGDKDNCSVGINRLDFDLNYSVVPSAIFMGSIFGDQEKNSVNKRCRPRHALGELCKQVVGPGSVDMIRKTIDGQIEEFQIQGGRVIDDNGAWAYQIPMNLDYMITDENGDLILSNDTNKGIPTRASVRFRIGMDEIGDEGRLRTRAKYLVPNNPTTADEVDYEFGSNTKDSSFRDLYWNKIYSVSNFISRFQRNNVIDNFPTVYSTKSTTGVKNVDLCEGTATPFPYNRANATKNPIFFFLCLIITLIMDIVNVINFAMIPIINFMVEAINFIINALNKILVPICTAINTIQNIWGAIVKFFGGDPISAPPCDLSISKVCYVRCIHFTCGDNGAIYAPGCHYPDTKPNPTPYTKGLYDVPSGASGCSVLPTTTNVIEQSAISCQLIQLAEALNVFQLDFYNDWINGSLFGFLLKYKKRPKGEEFFCEYDCVDFTSVPDYTGVDGNLNGIPDNNCFDNYLVDTCFTNDGVGGIPGVTSSLGIDTQNSYNTTTSIRAGLIKKVGNEFYYAATTHANSNKDAFVKLFATDIINLGGVFSCDWQGIPKIQQYLTTTTYKRSPDTVEIGPDGKTIEASGLFDILDGRGSVFFTIDCNGVHMDNKGALNIRHQCEFGVNIDELQEEYNATIRPDNIIGVNDIDINGHGKFVRDVFYGLNKTGASIYSFKLPTTGFTTNFNIGVSNTGGNIPNYNFASTVNNGTNYISFRGVNTNQAYAQPAHSYFFYFGLLPGKTALDKMNKNFFTTCTPITRDDMVVQASSNSSMSVTTGNFSYSITFTVIGGKPTYQYTVTGVNGTTYQNPVTGTLATSSGGVINNLAAGTYLITVTDSLGTIATKTIVIVANTIVVTGGGGNAG